MKNEEKAQEICEKNKRFKVECSSLECYLSAMEIAEWKDEQHAEEKQQWIEKACAWLKDNAGAYQEDLREYGEGCDYDTESLLEDFRKAMEE